MLGYGNTDMNIVDIKKRRHVLKALGVSIALGVLAIILVACEIPVQPGPVPQRTAGITISETALSVGGNGGRSTYTVRLDTRPGAAVIVTPASSDTTMARVSGALTFTTGNWEIPQPVTVTGVNNNIDDTANRSATITHRITGDSTYAALPVGSVAVTVINDSGRINDGPGVIITPDHLTLLEGTETIYTVQLSSQPAGEVLIRAGSSNIEEVTINPDRLTFTGND